MNYLLCKALLLQRKIATHLYYTKLYETNVGIKYIFPLYDSSFIHGDNIIYIQPKDLFLDFDALKDEYTLCDSSIQDSPHLSFLHAIDNNLDVMETDYVRRYQNGTLDIRIPHYITKVQIRYFKEKFAKRKEEILSRNYSPVVVYNIAGRFYIADGKHRAAMCVLLGQEVKCQMATIPYLEDSFNRWIYNKMKEHPQRYKKNIIFFERYYCPKQ